MATELDRSSWFDATPAILMIADDPARVAEATAAIDQIGARIAASIDHGDAPARLARQAAAAAVLIDAAGIDPAMLDATLGAYQAAIPVLGDGGVILFDRDQLDAVAARQWPARVSLLCGPHAGELAAALALAALPPILALNDSSYEAERLHRLNEEVARIAETLSRLARNEPPLPTMRDRTMDYAGPPPATPITATRVRAAIRARRLREQYFDTALFADPAWDMLLDLFAAELERDRVSVSSLCIAAAVPPTTALRWITTMIEAGLLGREPDPADRRRAYVTLSSGAGIAMRNLCAALDRAGLAIP